MLAEEHCSIPRRDEAPLSETETAQFIEQIPGWQIVEQDGVPRLERTYSFKNFIEALAFTNQVGEIAEQQDHHPALLTEWGKVTISWWTHAVGGLHRNDFIMAARCDAIYQEQ
jgi:4a-hydroxytetrahydrobiopterin dehydratase